MSMNQTVTVIPGDGIGPECVDSAIAIIDSIGVDISWEERHAGERVFVLPPRLVQRLQDGEHIDRVVEQVLNPIRSAH